MSRQVMGAGATLLANTTAANGVPSGDQAGRLVMATAYPGATPMPIDWLMRVRIQSIASPPASTAFEMDGYLWGRDAEDEVWGQIGINDGQINNATTISETGIVVVRYFSYTNLGLFQDLWLQVANLVGADIQIDATLWPVYNCEANGLVGPG